MAINGDAPGHLAKALQKVSGRLLQISTDYVFDGVSSRPYLPDDSTNPLSVYGRTKVAGERAAGSNSIILRTSWVYSSNGSNFVLTMLGLMKENKVLGVVDDQIGAPSWAQGVARVIWDLVAAGEAGIFHHRDAGETSWHGFAVAIAEESYKLGLIDKIPVIQPIRTADYPTAAPRPAYSVLDDSATRVHLGYTTQHWRENLRQLLKELARHS